MTGRGTTAIIGAGPHGLAVAAHLLAADMPIHVFGETLSFWRDHMPEGMLLSSAPQSSHIADPDAQLTLDAWAAATGRELKSPIPLFDFIDYGHWFQRHAVPDVDPRHVRRVSRASGGFRLELDDGTEGQVERVVVAAGIQPFARIRPDLARLGRERVSHSSDHAHFRDFRARRVAVVGCGQSALESAALLCEAGASVDVIARAPAPRWLTPRAAAPTDLGGRISGWLTAAPPLWRGLPRRLREAAADRCTQPSGTDWLRPRLAGARLYTGSDIQSAHSVHDGVLLDLTVGGQIVVDHLVLATGFAIDVARYPFLDPGLVGGLRIKSGHPLLGHGLESSVRGLHFVGAPAAYSFGPVMRFVVGSWYAGSAVASAIAGRGQAKSRFWSFAPPAQPETRRRQLVFPTSETV